MKEQKTLNQWRKERGLGVDELAEKSGVGRHLTNLLYSGITPRLKAGLALAEALNIDVTQILWEKVEREDAPAMPGGPEVEGNQRRVSREQYEVARQWLKAGRTMTEIADAIGVSRGTLYKVFKRFEEEDGPQTPSKGPAVKAAGGAKATPRKPKATKADS